jgi:hypothetical protein
VGSAQLSPDPLASLKQLDTPPFGELLHQVQAAATKAHQVGLSHHGQLTGARGGWDAMEGTSRWLVTPMGEMVLSLLWGSASEAGPDSHMAG